ncbi:hypothetical protein INR49_000413 [Caranx melampygus]|nr:hypothetical protein INR49_000413 [Caranx melampygus]
MLAGVIANQPGKLQGEGCPTYSSLLLPDWQDDGQDKSKGMTRNTGKKKMSLYDSQAPVCPICQVLLRPGELQEHMETEIERLASICLSKNPSPKEGITTPGTPKAIEPKKKISDGI